MITNNNYKTLKALESTNPNAYSVIVETADEHLKTLAHASHEIKNMVSFMNSSYQLISKQHPETTDFRFWKEFGDNINRLVKFMDRTSMYRYCVKANLKPVNLMDIIYTLPDEADSRHPETSRNFRLNIHQSIAETACISAHSEHLTLALNEIIDNCYDATTSEDDTITISVESSDNSYVHIAISNPGTFPAVEYREPGSSDNHIYERTDATILCKPFYTTKNQHSGLGLSIAYTVCTNHNGDIWFEQVDGESVVHITLPLHHSS